MAYGSDQEDTLVALNVVASVFSFIGASFIIGNYYLFTDLRSFAFKLVLFVAIGDMINCIGNFMGSPPRGFLCDFQGLITQFGDLTSFGWVTAIAWTIYAIFTGKDPVQIANKYYKRMHICIWTTTIVLSLLPITTASYGPSGGLCWIQGEVGETTAEVWRWLCFYLPLWGAIGYMIFVYSKVWNEMKAPAKKPSSNNVNPNVNANGTGNTSNELPTSTEIVNQPSDENIRESNSQIMNDNAGGSSQNAVGQQSSSANSGGGGSNLQRIKWYPVVLFVCYFFATVRRLDELITATDAPFGLAAIQVFMSACLGAGNALVYGLSPLIRERDIQYIKSCLGKETAPAPNVGVEYASGSTLAQTERLRDHDGNAVDNNNNNMGHNRTESDNVELGDANQVR